MTEFRDDNSVEFDLSKKIYFLILVSGFTWMILIFLAPVFMKLGGSFEKISSYIYLFFSKVCHQQDDRSFHILEHQLGVCSRCVWIYAGFFLGTALYPLKFKLNNIQPPSIWFLICAVLLLLLDVLLDELGIVMNSFFTRSLTGLIIGVILPMYIIPGFIKFFYEVHTFLRNKVST